MPTPNTTTHRKVHGLGWIKRGTQQEKTYLQNKARREQKALQEKEIRAGRPRSYADKKSSAVGRGKGAVKKKTGTGKGVRSEASKARARARGVGTGKGGLKKKK